MSFVGAYWLISSSLGSLAPSCFVNGFCFLENRGNTYLLCNVVWWCFKTHSFQLCVESENGCQLSKPWKDCFPLIPLWSVVRVDSGFHLEELWLKMSLNCIQTFQSFIVLNLFFFQKYICQKSFLWSRGDVLSCCHLKHVIIIDPNACTMAVLGNKATFYWEN